MLARLAAAALGIWLMAAPAALHATGAASTSMHVLGPVVIGLSVAAAAPVLDGVRWLLLPVAGWLIVAPWVLGGEAAAVAASVLVGVLLIPLACVAHRGAHRYGGGWGATAPLLRRPAHGGRPNDA